MVSVQDCSVNIDGITESDDVLVTELCRLICIPNTCRIYILLPILEHESKLGVIAIFHLELSKDPSVRLWTTWDMKEKRKNINENTIVVNVV